MNSTFNISLLSIGDELCIGQTLNSNVHWISKELVKVGANIDYHLTIKDDKKEIIKAIEFLKPSSDLILVTGGLGPTHDDITKKVLTEYFDDKMELNEKVLADLKEYFKTRGRDFLDRHYEQAMMPSKCKIIDNKVGTAQGMLFIGEGFELLSMPGVPREMQYIMSNSFLKYIENKIIENNYNVMVYRTLRTAGVPESTLADLIGDIEFLNGSSLAFLPSYAGVKLRIGTSTETYELAKIELNRLEKYIMERCSDFIYSNTDENLENYLADLLTTNNFKISAAESCTGGLFGAKITAISGSSEYFNGSAVTYSNEAKINLLGVNKETISKFGAVSEECAKEMANGSREKYNTDFAISITGVAGPSGGSEVKPVGTIWIGLSSEKETYAKKFVFTKDREVNRELSVHNAINILVKEIEKELGN